jgi:hypothetical protein
MSDREIYNPPKAISDRAYFQNMDQYTKLYSGIRFETIITI